jgi:sulfur-oxidizing protein SoxY
MNFRTDRRHLFVAVLRLAAGILALGLQRGAAAAEQAATALWSRDWNEAAFTTRGLAETAAALGWTGPLLDNAGVHLQAPEIAESGAVVPVEVSSTIADTRRIALLVLDNPNTLVADFRLGSELAPRIATRIKLAETTTVVALVETGSGIRVARQVVKVTAGGCGG